MLDRIVLVGAGRTSGPIVDRLARIAPLTIIDTSAAALDVVSSRRLEEGAELHPIVKRAADGTSRLVLQDLRGDPSSGVGLVIAPGDDRAALEVCRLAAEVGYAPIVAIVNDRAVADQCEKHGARALVRAGIVGQLVEQSLLQGGIGGSAAVGFGKGEILEFSVLPSSPAIGIPLAQLSAEGWRVAAIYRGNRLVLPLGTTTLVADDRVLLVGEPRQLPHVVETLRVGVPTFPLLHGPNIVVYLPDGRDGGIETEAEVLALRTRANRLIRVMPGVTKASKIVDTPFPGGGARKRFEEAPLEGLDLTAHVKALLAQQPGVVVAKARGRAAGDVLFGRGGLEAKLCNEVGVPVLFPRGSAEYKRVVLCIADGHVEMSVAEVALDLSRMLSVPLLILLVRLPEYLEAADAKTDKTVEAIALRARLYGLAPDVRTVEGNPIDQWVRASEVSDLAVIGRAPSTRDSFSQPDLALRVARGAKGSVLVLTVKP